MLDEKFDLEQISSNSIQHDFLSSFMKCWMKLARLDGSNFCMLDESKSVFSRTKQTHIYLHDPVN